MSDNDLLIISHAFPPRETVGAIRPSIFAEVLRKAGWTIEVLTTPESNREQQDSLFSTQSVLPERVDFGRLGWTPTLAHTLYRHVRERQPDLIWFTGAPFPPAIVLPLLKRLSSVPYVLDMRDPWVLAPYKDIPSRAQRWFLKTMERTVIENARAVTTTSERTSERYRQHYHGTNFRTVRNGFRETRTVRRSGESTEETIKIVCPGKIYQGESVFAKALVHLADQPTSSVTFTQIGKHSSTIERITDGSKQAEYESMDYVNHDTLMDLIAEADIGLLTNRDPAQIPMKTYDYIAADTPVLALCSEDSSIGDVLQKFEGTGFVENPTPERIAETTLALRVEQSLTKGVDRTDYSFRSRGEELHQVLTDIVQSEP
ncbi:glycosyltransferase [Haloarcula laminariae]|uniref:glycosyltransferase n=1 Tax=Haloarcula laminariae TaxID=2961577 RepID=UPI0021C98662|nr:glycosyltransferase [Halomicroarcula laminariae]